MTYAARTTPASRPARIASTSETQQGYLEVAARLGQGGCQRERPDDVPGLKPRGEQQERTKQHDIRGPHHPGVASGANREHQRDSAGLPRGGGEARARRLPARAARRRTRPETTW